jgi:hypothetical protein
MLLLQEIPRRQFHVTPEDGVVGLIAALVVIVCVLVHYEMMSTASRVMPHIGLPRRTRIVGVILTMIIAHVIEVWIFGLAYWYLDQWPSLGTLVGRFQDGALDFVYFSVVSYTTLGYGDIVPEGAIGILAGTEALVGLSLITWSASFAFLEMQRDWFEFNPSRHRRFDGPGDPGRS